MWRSRFDCTPRHFESSGSSAEEAARKSAVKMLFPTILFIFPVLLLVVLVPSLLQIQRVIGEVIKRG